MNTIVVGVDATAEGVGALALARSIAGPDDSIVAVHAWELPVIGSYEGVAAVDPNAVQGDARRFLDETLADAGDERIESRLTGGPGGHAVLDVADEVNAVLVVIGTHGSNKITMLLGSDAHHVVHHTKRPVIVARGECRTPIRTVAVGVDDPLGDEHDTSADALRWALALDGPEQVEVHHAAFVPGVAAGPVRQAAYESPDEVAELEAGLAAAVAAVHAEGITPSAEVVPIVSGGTAAFCLIERSREVDLVVVGTRGRSGIMELLTGSTTLDVLAHAHCPVAVIH